MKKPYFFVILALAATINLYAQTSYLTVADGFRSREILPEMDFFSCFDVHDQKIFAQDGDSISVIDFSTREILYKINNPEGYSAYPVFLKHSPSENKLWAGYSTSSNINDRIYTYNLDTQHWTLAANFTACYDLNFYQENVLVSGSNSADWNTPNAIFVLDVSGENNHRKIIESMGSPSGFAIDNDGNIYSATASIGATNSMFHWNSALLNNLLSNPEAPHLTIADAQILSNLPATASDTELDEAGNLFFNYNDFSGAKVLAKWNGNAGSDLNFDILAYSNYGSEWFTYIKAIGNAISPEPGNELLMLSFGRPLASVYKARGPQISQPLPTIMMEGMPPLAIFDLNEYFSHPDEEPISFSIASNSFDEVAGAYINQSIYLVIEYISSGQTTLQIEASANGVTVSSKMIVGVLPIIEGDYVVSDFENFESNTESFWNGSDQSGGYESGLGFFYNNYNPDWGVWSGWAYSNKTDNTTPGLYNQFSAITGQGVFSQTTEVTGTYALAYTPENFKFTEPSAHQLRGFFITNTTYAGLSMKYGDDFSKRFGGSDGNDPDWFMLKVLGLRNGEAKDSVEFYLADYRFEDNTKDYIVETWQWLELSELGKVDSLEFQLSSSDNAEWGMNTPAYFAIDNIYILPDLAPEIASLPDDVTLIYGDGGYSLPIAGIFTDPDDDDDLIEISVLDDYNHDLISVELVNGNLNIIPLANLSESTEITMVALSNGKTIAGSITVTVQSTLGIAENKPSGISVYPNPVDSHFQLLGLEFKNPVTLELLSTTGQVVLRKLNFYPDDIVETNNLTSGTYLVRIQSDTESWWTKLILR